MGKVIQLYQRVLKKDPQKLDKHTMFIDRKYYEDVNSLTN